MEALSARAQLVRRPEPAESVCLFPGRACLFLLLGTRGKALEVDLGGYDVAHLFLKFVDRQSAIEDHEIVRVYHLVVFLEDARLKEAKTFGAFVGETHVHARFVIFQFGTAAEDAVDGDVERSTEIKGDVRNRGEAVEIAQPAMRTATGGVARKRGVNVPVGEDEIVALEERHNLALAAVGKVRGMQQGK